MIEVEELYRRFSNAPENKRYMALLPLLEYEYRSGADELLQSTPLSNYHLALLIEYALQWEVACSWPELALNWIEAGFPVDKNICKILFQKSKKGNGFSQKQRHRSMRIATNWENET